MPSNPRITVSVDVFLDKIISKMADFRNTSKSDITGKIIHQWIEQNTEILENNYGVNLNEVKNEIKMEGNETTMEDLIEKLMVKFENIRSISMVKLADHLEVDQGTIEDLIITHGKEIRKRGLDLEYVDGKVKKVG